TAASTVESGDGKAGYRNAWRGSWLYRIPSTCDVRQRTDIGVTNRGMVARFPSIEGGEGSHSLVRSEQAQNVLKFRARRFVVEDSDVRFAEAVYVSRLELHAWIELTA